MSRNSTKEFDLAKNAALGDRHDLREQSFPFKSSVAMRNWLQELASKIRQFCCAKISTID